MAEAAISGETTKAGGVREVNFDGIVGPSHHYGGLSLGNIASSSHGRQESQPRRAALEGLAKMKELVDLGIPQAVLPPHDRPALEVLWRAGFSGSDAAVVEKCWKEAPALLSACYSASAMWTANAATFTPGVDIADGLAHFTPANLVSMFHRSIETSFTAQVLRRIFDAGNRFRHHSPLPPVNAFGDEGAANHTRLCRKHGESGLHLFVYGFAPFGEDSSRPRRFPARQSLEASRAIARLHGIPGRRAVFLQQAPEAIDAGAFHNDVVAVGNEDLFLFHEQAFAGGGKAVAELAGAFERQSGTPLQWLEIPAARLSLEEAIRTYFFNSQLISLPEGGMLLVAPEECRGSAVLRNLIGELPDRSGGRIRGARFVGIRQSMRNGGGPACLRMRVPLSPEERGALAGRLFLDDALYAELCAWVERNYREELRPPDLADPELLDETRRALDELSRLLLLPNLYRFQQQ